MITQAVKVEYSPTAYLNLPGRRLAYALTEGKAPRVVFLGGFKSDMSGTKATALEEFCREEGQSFLRFDYSGHGQSSGEFRQGTISQWKQDTLDILDNLTKGPVVLVGSSLGAWLGLLAALQYPGKVAGFIGIAPAADFTHRLVWQKLNGQQKKQLKEVGSIMMPDCYGGDPCPITRALIDDGRKNLLLEDDHVLNIPIRLIHGTEDKEVPWRMSFTLMEHLKSPDISLELVKGGDHRLSYPGPLATIFRTLEEVLSLV